MRRALVLLLASVVLSACPGGGDGDATPDTVEPGDTEVLQPTGGAECSKIESFPIQGTTHVPDTEDVEYSTSPPTSGPHWQEWVTPTGTYDEELPDERLVHNLEHGHVVIRYRDDVADEERQAMLAPVLADPFMTIVAPEPDQPWKLALSSWGRAQVCTSIPADVGDVVRRFVERNRNHAPESIP